MKERSQDRKMKNRLDGIVRKMEDDGENKITMEPIINLARVLKTQVLESDSDSDNSSQLSTSS